MYLLPAEVLCYKYFRQELFRFIYFVGELSVFQNLSQYFLALFSDLEDIDQTKKCLISVFLFQIDCVCANGNPRNLNAVQHINSILFGSQMLTLASS